MRSRLRFLLLLAIGPRAAAQFVDPLQNIGQRPELLKDVGIDQKLNDEIPLDLTFRDEHGKTVELAQYFGSKPVILTLVYYNCPMLCTQVLNGLDRTLKLIPMDIGKDFNVVTVSIDPTERPVLAEAKQAMYVGMYGRPGAAEGWHFLTGDEKEIKQLAQAVGFRYAYDAESKQFAHASAIMMLTPEGRMSRYFYGIQYPERDVRLGLVEASQGKNQLADRSGAAVLLSLRSAHRQIRTFDFAGASTGRSCDDAGRRHLPLFLVSGRTLHASWSASVTALCINRKA